MGKLVSRMTMALLLATSCFLVTGCGEPGPSDPGSNESGASSAVDADKQMEAAEGSGAKKPSDGSGSK